jgi:CheY-like chemotaxis protein
MTAPHRIMVVDDDVDLRETMLDVLRDAGFEAIGAANGADALQCLALLDRLPCVIFLDLMMPVMDGSGFRQKQLADPTLADIPVVAISAYRDVAEQANVLGVPHLAKPIRLETIRETALRFCRELRSA